MTTIGYIIDAMKYLQLGDIERSERSLSIARGHLFNSIKEKSEPPRDSEMRNLLITAIRPMFNACGNSYINAWLEDWLRTIAPVTGYPGPFTGNIVEVMPDVNEWVDANQGEGCK